VKVLKEIDNQQAFDLILTIGQLQLRRIKGVFTYDYYATEPSTSNIMMKSTILGELRCNLYLVSRRMKCDLGRAANLKTKEKFSICHQMA
jgi:hypothetical protein